MTYEYCSKARRFEVHLCFGELVLFWLSSPMVDLSRQQGPLPYLSAIFSGLQDRRGGEGRLYPKRLRPEWSRTDC